MKIQKLIGALLLLCCATIVACEIIVIAPPQGPSIQERLDLGESPFDIYQENTQFKDSLYGATYQGGIIFNINISSGWGYIVAPDDLGDFTWGCFPNKITNTYIDFANGATNTYNIYRNCGQANFAARACFELVLNGYDDWFLPSPGEFSAVHTNLFLQGKGNFSATPYWTSHEDSDRLAQCFQFHNSLSSEFCEKNQSLRVRPMRQFRRR